jgi:type VI protein secretion system component VasK
LAAWIDFEKNNCAAGIVELTQVIGRLPAAKSPDDVPAKEHQPIFEWAGKLREFAETLAKNKVPTAEQLAALDAAVERQGKPAAKAYKIGRDKVAAIRTNFDTQMENAPDDAKRFQLRVDRHKLKNYMSAFPFDVHIQRATATLDD